MDKDVVLHSLKDLKYVLHELDRIRNSYEPDEEDYYQLETLMVFIKLIYCKLRNMIMRDVEIKKLITEKKI